MTTLAAECRQLRQSEVYPGSSFAPAVSRGDRSADLRAAHLRNYLLAEEGERFAATRRNAPAQHREKMACTAFAALIDDLFGDLRRRARDIVIVMQGKSGPGFR